MSSRKKAPPDGDLTARARIRDAAVECFGKRGFDVPIRVIAERAGVSPGLVIHHYGTKARLREACDEHVREVIVEAKSRSIVTDDPQGLLSALTRHEEYAGVLAYVVRAARTGGELGRHLFENLVADAERYLALGEAEGTVRPSRDPARRARWLAASALGSILVLVSLGGAEDAEPDYQQVLHDWEREYMLPALEVYTEGLLTERTMLDAYLLYVSDPPEEEN